MNGTVYWFDELAGEGMIKGADGHLYYFHESAIESESRFRSLNEKENVKFKTIGDSTFTQVLKIKVI
jgi:cold shock CspA family protein